MRQCTVAMSFAFVSEGISPDTSLSLKSVAHLKNKKIHKIYRKRKAEQERLQSPEKTQQPDARVEKALCIKVMKKIMVKEDLKSQLNDKKTSLDELSKHQQMDTRTIKNMILSLLAVEMYGRS